MKKTKLVLAVALASVTFTPITHTILENINIEVVEAQQEQTERRVALGATLDENLMQQTLALLGAADIPQGNIIHVDGDMINSYLNDGSTQATTVYSSAIIEPRESGYGVQVQIVTPDNILTVAPQTYQNAAITAGAKDVLIKIASPSPVTGEGALTGVYAMYEASGQQLSQQSIQVAQKEIEVVNKVQEVDGLSEEQVNQLQVKIKHSISLALQGTVELSDAEVNELVQQVIQAFSEEHGLTISAETQTELANLAIEFSKTETAQDEQTTEQLEASTGDVWTMEQAIDFWETTFLSGLNGERIIRENYDRSYWSEVSQEDLAIVLHLRNAGAGGNYYVFEKSGEVTIITLFSGNASYPDDPTAGYWVRNSDFRLYQEYDNYTMTLTEYAEDGTTTETQAPGYSEEDPATPEENAWSFDSAIDFWETTFLSGLNGEQIIRENYDRSYWSEVSQEDLAIVLHLRNAGAGGNYYVFEKSGEVTIITLFSGNASYPDDPTASYWVRNSDFRLYQEYDNYTMTLTEYAEDGTATETQAPGYSEEDPATPEENAWSFDSAIDFWEATFLNDVNGEQIIRENYDRSYWTETSNNGNTIVLHLRNAGTGGNYYTFEKLADETIVTLYSGNATYPDNPTVEYTVSNSDFVILQEYDY